ncbi:hypothetical protein HYQ46_007339 [Verticillium longisporum]|nr:hypothetical protein HYQ46_007339 [Verticillium longisporum]
MPSNAPTHMPRWRWRVRASWRAKLLPHSQGLGLGLLNVDAGDAGSTDDAGEGVDAEVIGQPVKGLGLEVVGVEAVHADEVGSRHLGLKRLGLGHGRRLRRREVGGRLLSAPPHPLKDILGPRGTCWALRPAQAAA